jgi:hypothetical protein
MTKEFTMAFFGLCKLKIVKFLQGEDPSDLRQWNGFIENKSQYLSRI